MIAHEKLCDVRQRVTFLRTQVGSANGDVDDQRRLQHVAKVDHAAHDVVVGRFDEQVIRIEVVVDHLRSQPHELRQSMRLKIVQGSRNSAPQLCIANMLENPA